MENAMERGSAAPPVQLGPGTEPLESIAAVIDALADERCLPRAEIIRTMIADLEGRIAVDRAVIVLLRRLERG